MDGLLMSPEELAAKICWPVEEWPGHCYALACEFVDTGLIAGEAEYGIYFGPVSPGGIFDPKKGCHRHGWIRRPDRGIIDPTRWVFEVVVPYIAVFEPDDEAQYEYDMGGAKYRRIIFGDDLPPSFDPCTRIFDEVSFGWEILVESNVHLLLGGGPPWSIQQIQWLANRSPDQIGPSTIHVYEGLTRQNLQVMIPIDFRISVFGRNHMEVERLIREEDMDVATALSRAGPRTVRSGQRRGVDAATHNKKCSYKNGGEAVQNASRPSRRKRRKARGASKSR